MQCGHGEPGGDASRGAQPGVPLLAARGISKAFPGVQALREVDLTCHAGRVQALVGENGAGKSTLTAVLTGVVQPDAGEIAVDGEAVRFAGPRDALRAGIAAVHQEFTLLAHMTVAENVMLGHEPASRGLVRRGELRERAAGLLRDLGMAAPPVATPAGRLSVAQQQIVEIAKALAHDARLLIMDEPSAVLAGAELDRLFEVIRGLAARGVSIVYISHRLAEVEAIADDVAILRDGQVVSSCPRRELTREEGGVLSRPAERNLAVDAIRQLGIRVSGPGQRTRQLSGGNQQKVVLGKWLAAEPRVLILDEPLRGVDVGAKAEIYEIIRRLADGGAGILLISSELPEILGLADRVVVMRDGRIAGELDAREATETSILALAIGEDAG